LIERIPPISGNAVHKSQAVDKLRELWAVMERELNNVDSLEKRLNEVWNINLLKDTLLFRSDMIQLRTFWLN
jgi:hypothetical protein